MSDLIRRQAALAEFVDGRDVYDIMESIESLPPEDRPTKWIPCSERLPSEGEFYVLCCDKHGEIMIGNVFECDDGETPYSAESENEYMYNCVAWMPLPEPYKAESEETNEYVE